MDPFGYAIDTGTRIAGKGLYRVGEGIYETGKGLSHRLSKSYKKRDPIKSENQNPISIKPPETGIQDVTGIAKGLPDIPVAKEIAKGIPDVTGIAKGLPDIPVAKEIAKGIPDVTGIAKGLPDIPVAKEISKGMEYISPPRIDTLLNTEKITQAYSESLKQGETLKGMQESLSTLQKTLGGLGGSLDGLKTGQVQEVLKQKSNSNHLTNMLLSLSKNLRPSFYVIPGPAFFSKITTKLIIFLIKIVPYMFYLAFRSKNVETEKPSLFKSILKSIPFLMGPTFKREEQFYLYWWEKILYHILNIPIYILWFIICAIIYFIIYLLVTLSSAWPVLLVFAIIIFLVAKLWNHVSDVVNWYIIPGLNKGIDYGVKGANGGIGVTNDIIDGINSIGSILDIINEAISGITEGISGITGGISGISDAIGGLFGGGGGGGGWF